jgi:hypothetical protein
MGRKKSQAVYKKVIVKWKDACVWNDGAISIDKALDLDMPVRETIGYLISKTKEKIVLVGFYDHDEQECDVITIIPMQWAIEINELK